MGNRQSPGATSPGTRTPAQTPAGTSPSNPSTPSTGPAPSTPTNPTQTAPVTPQAPQLPSAPAPVQDLLDLPRNLPAPVGPLTDRLLETVTGIAPR